MKVADPLGVEGAYCMYFPFESHGHGQSTVMDKRKQVRRVVCLRTVVADKTGLATVQLTDLSERGCRLYLFKAFAPRQYLTLKVYPDDGTVALQIDLAKVKWSGNQMAGVQFLSLSPENMMRLARLCGDADE